MFVKKCICVVFGLVVVGVFIIGFVVCLIGDFGDGGGSFDEFIIVGFVVVGFEGVWCEVNEQNIQDIFIEEVGYDFKYVFVINFDQKFQIDVFMLFVDEGVDVILFFVIEVFGWEDFFKCVQEVEIFVILFDWGIEFDDDSFYVICIVFDNIEVVKEVGVWVVVMFFDGGNYVVLEGFVGVGVVNEWNIGFDEGFGDFLFIKFDVQIVNWLVEEGKSVFEIMFKLVGNDIQFVFVQNDEMGFGVVQVVEEVGFVVGEDVKIVMIDGMKNVMQVFVDGQFSYVYEYNLLFGDIVFEVVEKVFVGEDVELYIVVFSEVFDLVEVVQVVFVDCKY